MGLVTDVLWWVAGTALNGGAFLVYFLRFQEPLFVRESMVGAVNEYPGLPPQSRAEAMAEDRIRADD